MTFWYLLLAAAALIALSACVYVTRRIHRFTPIKRLGERHALLSWLVSLCPLAVVEGEKLLRERLEKPGEKRKR